MLDAGGPTEDGHGPGWLGHQVSEHLQTHAVVVVVVVLVGVVVVVVVAVGAGAGAAVILLVLLNLSLSILHSLQISNPRRSTLLFMY